MSWVRVPLARVRVSSVPGQGSFTLAKVPGQGPPIPGPGFPQSPFGFSLVRYRVWSLGFMFLGFGVWGGLGFWVEGLGLFG